MASIVEPRVGFDLEDGSSSRQITSSQRKKAAYFTMTIALGAVLGAGLFLVMGGNGLSPTSRMAPGSSNSQAYSQTRFASAFKPRVNALPRSPVAGISMSATETKPGVMNKVKDWFGTLTKTTGLKQDFLELENYPSFKGMPMNTFKPKEPYVAKILSVERMVGPDAMGETCNMIIDHGGNVPYIEGQSYGVVPPGTKANGKPNAVRLYSIASSRYGDDMTGKTATLCVKRATYWDPELKAEDPAKQGLCSNYMCDLKAGDEIKLTGPTGAAMLLPEDKPEADIIMFATGTGIAPFRAFLRRMFLEDTPYARDFKGLAWLFLGVYNKDSLLYDEEWKDIKSKFPDQFNYDLALSDEQKKEDGSSMYVQDRAAEYAGDIFDRLEKGAHLYVCGLKGMVSGIEEMLEKTAKEKGVDYAEFMKKIKSNKQWHVEVY